MGAISIPELVYRSPIIFKLNEKIKRDELSLHWADYSGGYKYKKDILSTLIPISYFFELNSINIIFKDNQNKTDYTNNEIEEMMYFKFPERIFYGLLRDYNSRIKLTPKIFVENATAGVQSFFGYMYAKDEIDLLNNHFDRIEWFVHTGVTYLYGMAAILINSFVMLYTLGVEGVSYQAPLFALMIILANVAYSLRTPYNLMVLAAGHFRQTQKIYYIEAGLNLILSLILVHRFELTGVAVGTLISMGSGTVALVFYLSRNIVFRPVEIFLKHFLVDALSFGAMMIIGAVLTNIYTIESFLGWIIVALLAGVVNLILLAVINLVFYRQIMVSSVKGLLRKAR